MSSSFRWSVVATVVAVLIVLPIFTRPPMAVGVPSGVTLRNIDGGPTYYADNGWTYAAGAGWDNPSFFPIGTFLASITTQGHANVFKDLGINLMIAMQSQTSLSMLRANNIYAIPQYEELNLILGNNGGSLGTESVGLDTKDEPGTYPQATVAIQNTPNSVQNNRFWYVNFTYTPLQFGEVGGVSMVDWFSRPVSTPNGTTRHFDLASIDAYWFNASASPSTFGWQGVWRVSNMTSDQYRRACHYGDMIDLMRSWQSGRAPLSVFIETGGSFLENTTLASYIRPAELNAAVWSTIIHGARYVQYFDHSFAGPGSGQHVYEADTFFTTIQSGETISIYNQMKATNGLVRALATVINSPFADGYVSVTPASTGKSDWTGFDLMAKYHNRGASADNDFYVFAMPRYSGSTTNQTATFTIKNTGATQVSVVNEGRTIPITNGGTQFQDTFANGNTVHIYRVNSGTTTTTPAAPSNLRIIK
jgi:hypothetical protein